MLLQRNRVSSYLHQAPLPNLTDLKLSLGRVKWRHNLGEGQLSGPCMKVKSMTHAELVPSVIPLHGTPSHCVRILSLNGQGTPPKAMFPCPGTLQSDFPLVSSLARLPSRSHFNEGGDRVRWEAATLRSTNSRGMLQSRGPRVSPRAAACKKGRGPTTSSAELCPLCVPMAGTWTSVDGGQ